METWVIIPAAGAGSRFGAKKQFEFLAGKPILVTTLEKFDSISQIDGIVCVVSEEDVAATHRFVDQAGLNKVKKIIPGGNERQDSVRRGFNAIPPCDLVLVHDAARPLVRLETVKKVIERAIEKGSCVVGVKTGDTTKKVDSKGLVLETVSRDSLWQIQTPQGFRYGILKEAIERAERDKFLGTDEAMLVERIGKPVYVIEGDRWNIKITTREDLELAEKIMEWN